MGSIIIILLALACMILPFLITALDIYYLCIPYDKLTKTAECLEEDTTKTGKFLKGLRTVKRRRLNYHMAVYFGAFCQVCWEGFAASISQKQWNEALITGAPEGEDFHEYISTEFGGWYWAMLALSVIVTLVMNFMYEERKAAMVSNLLVVLCGNHDAQPVVNSGSIY